MVDVPELIRQIREKGYTLKEISGLTGIKAIKVCTIANESSPWPDEFNQAFKLLALYQDATKSKRVPLKSDDYL